MFSRAAKSIVKVIGQRKYHHAGDENIRLAMIGGAGEIGRGVSQMLKQTSKLDVLALYDVAASSKRFSSMPAKFHSFSEGDTLNHTNSRMLTMLEKSRSGKEGVQSEANYFSNRPSNVNQNETEEILSTLRRLPIVEESAADQLASTNKSSRGLRGPRVLGEIGPDKFPRSGRILSEICRRFPGLAVSLRGVDRSGRVNGIPSRRQISNLATSNHSTMKNEEKRGLDILSYPRIDEYPAATGDDFNSTVEKFGEKVRGMTTEVEKPKILSRERKEKNEIVTMDSVSKKVVEADGNSTTLEKNQVQTLKTLSSELKGKHQPMTIDLVSRKEVEADGNSSSLEKSHVRVGKTVSPGPACVLPVISCPKIDEHLSTLKNNPDSTLENVQNKVQSKKEALKNFNIVSPEHRGITQPITIQKSCTKKLKESKIHEELPERSVKRSALVKSKNWTIPAALSDRKPRMLYGLVHQRRKPLAWFFSKFLDLQNDVSEGKYKIGKYIQNQEELNKDKVLKNRLNASTSTNDLHPSFAEEPSIQESSGVPEEFTKDSNNAEQCEKGLATGDHKKTFSSIEESEYDSTSDVSESPAPLKKISSKIAMFLETLKLDRLNKRSGSLSSLTSFNLESLFLIPETCTVSSGSVSPSTVFFSSKDSKPTLRDKLCKKFGGKKEKEEDICKRRQKTCKDDSKKPRESFCGQRKKERTCKRRDEARTTCGDGDNDPCKPLRNEKHGKTCKKYEEDEGYGKKHDPCRRHWKEETHGKVCKSFEEDQDPCKKFRTPDVHGKTCKEFRSEQGKDDPCAKCWNDQVHGKRCKEEKKKKRDTCQTPKICEKEKKKDSCKKERKQPRSCERERKKEKQRSCEKECKKESKKKCPPVFRAPGCPKDDGKGKGGSCRGYSTLASRIYLKNDFDFKNILKDLPKTTKSDSFNSRICDMNRLLYGKNSKD